MDSMLDRGRRMTAQAAILLALFVSSAWGAYNVKPSDIVPEWTGAEPGVWTMDYAAATNNAAGRGAWTIMQYTGMWWCPHCQALEDGVLTTPGWSNYVDRAGFYLVAMDYPYRDGYSNFCWLWDENYRRTKCGGMSAVEGTNTVYRRYAVQDAFSVPGATRQAVKLYDAQGNVTNAIEYGRVGYPTLLVLRPGGTVAGRFSVSKLYAALDYVTNRMEQVLQADAWDEPDNYWLTATDLAAPRCEDEPVVHGSHTLSIVDTADWYALAVTNAAGALWSFTCAANERVPAVPLKVELYADPTDEPIASKELTPFLDETFTSIIASRGEYWIKVMTVKTQTTVVGYDFSYAYSVSPAAVSFSKDEVSVRSSALSVALTVNIADADRAAEIAIDWKAVDGTATNGVDYLTSGGTLTWLSGEVKRSKTIQIPLIAAERWKGDRAFTVKLYPQRHCVVPEAVDECRVTITEAVARKPGTLTFDKSAVKEQQVVREGAPVAFEVSRTGGTDGAVTGVVSIVVGKTAQVVTNLVWAHGSDAVQTVRYAPERTPDYIREDTKATLKLAATGGARTGTSAAKLLLRDELVEMPLEDYSKAECSGALSASGVDWFYGRVDAESKQNVLRSCPLEGEETELAYKVRGPAIVEVQATRHGAAELQIRLDKRCLTNGCPARVAVPTGSHTVVLVAEGDGSAFVQADFRTVYLADYKLQADNPRNGRRLAVSESLSLASVPDAFVEAVEPGVTVATRIGSTSRLTDLPAAGADALTTTGYVYPQNAEQRTALLDFVRENLDKTLQWRMDVRFADAFGNVAEQAGVVARFIPVDEGAPCVDLAKGMPKGWTADADRAELTAPDMTVGVEEDAGPIALGNLSGGVASVAIKSGKLPPGITASVEDGAFALVGVPTKAGTFVAELVVNEKVTVGKAKSSVVGCSYQLTVYVRALDDVAATYDGYATEQAQGESAEAGMGTATFTAAKNGKVSGKFVYNGKSLSFSASAWEARTNDTFYLETTVKNGRDYLPVRVRLEYSDEVKELGDAQIMFEGTTYCLYANRWKSAEEAAVVAPLVGTYVGALVRSSGTEGAPRGTGYVSLSVRKDGTVVYSGMNSLGTAYSGKTTLFKAYDCCLAAGYYLGCYLYALPTSAKVTGSGLYGLVEIQEAERVNILSGRGSALIRDVNLDGGSVYAGVAWTNVLDVVGGSVASEGLSVGSEWRQVGAMTAFDDYDGRDGASGYALQSAPSNLVLAATAVSKAAFDANEWNATVASFAKATDLTSIRFVLNYDGVRNSRKRTITGKGVYVPNSARGVPFWAGYYTVPEVVTREVGGRITTKTVQTPLPWEFKEAL